MTENPTRTRNASLAGRPAARRLVPWVFALGMACLTVVAARAATADPTATAPESIPSPSLERLFRVATRVYSGSSPSEDSDFAQLKSLGITTIVSVDGARPDVDRARRHGLRYVHVPIGYDKITAERGAQLVKAAAMEPGPLYVHCHHGQHRGPAAAAVMCLATEGWTTGDALSWLHRAGTSSNYPGLYRSIVEFKPVDAPTLAAVPTLPEIAETSSLVDSMVAADSHLEHLGAAAKTGWKGVPGHPDLEPRHETTLLWEILRELGRQPSAYQELMVKSERSAEALRAALAGPSVQVGEADAALRALERTCAACHKAHRN